MPGTFNVDHRKLESGIYCPGIQIVGNREIVTMDVRVVAPYKDKILTVEELHTVEHILAVEVENACNNTDINKVYWGPMGCQTGFYLLLDTPINIEVKEAVDVLCKACKKVVDTPNYEVPARTKIECGNKYTLTPTWRVRWILIKILSMAEEVINNNEYGSYIYIEDN